MYLIVNKYKTAARILLILLITGLMTHSIILWGLDFFLSLRSKDIGSISSEIIDKRIGLRNFADAFFQTCLSIFFAGNIIITFLILKNEEKITFKGILFSLMITSLCVVMCVFPFSFIDEQLKGDYFFPLWNVLIVIGILCCAALMIFIKRGITFLYKK